MITEKDRKAWRRVERIHRYFLPIVVIVTTILLLGILTNGWVVYQLMNLTQMSAHDVTVMLDTGGASRVRRVYEAYEVAIIESLYEVVLQLGLLMIFSFVFWAFRVNFKRERRLWRAMQGADGKSETGVEDPREAHR